ncbi:MAG: dihydrodipicolinate synthase family protein [Chloroflexota bacterium]|nr:dihydrodipicolinate synthase family protein [Chloroflexota bacterium]
MSSRELSLLCMSVTPFHEDGTLDLEALRQHLGRLLARRIGVLLPGGGAGEAHSLSLRELRQVYEIGVEVGGGHVPVQAVLRESRTAAAMCEIAREAMRAGVDGMHIYQLDGGHMMVPNEREQDAYWSELLGVIDIPVVISIGVHDRYPVSVEYVKRLCDRYPQIAGITVAAVSTSYFMKLRDRLPDRVKLRVGIASLLQYGALGADKCYGPEPNIVPNICRSIVDSYRVGDRARMVDGVRTVQRLHNIVQEWAPSTARWVKMAMKVLGLGNGVMRRPYLLPPEDDQRRMAKAFAALRLQELEAQAGRDLDA